MSLNILIHYIFTWESVYWSHDKGHRYYNTVLYQSSQHIYNVTVYFHSSDHQYFSAKKAFTNGYQSVRIRLEIRALRFNKPSSKSCVFNHILQLVQAVIKTTKSPADWNMNRLVNLLSSCAHRRYRQEEMTHRANCFLILDITFYIGNRVPRDWI